MGLDLSGPGNSKDTALVALKPHGEGSLSVCTLLSGADDRDILSCVESLAPEGEIVIGIDAPLSYNIGGGDRPSDAQLRKKIVAAGLRPGTVMPPTLTRMVYLTVRGITVARLLQAACRYIRIAEVHPNAVMALRGASTDDVIAYKKDEKARYRLLEWLGQQGLEGICGLAHPSDHYVAACACALGAWKWNKERPVWIYPASPPFHPFDYVC